MEEGYDSAQFTTLGQDRKLQGLEQKLQILNAILSCMQLLGALLLGVVVTSTRISHQFHFLWVIIALSGFSSVVKYFTWESQDLAVKIFKETSLMAGILIIFLSIIS
jgi:hypothetical protein